MKKTFLVPGVAFLLLCIVSVVQASVITWQTVQDATGNVSDVVTTGTSIDAVTTWGSDLTINGVTFNHFTGISGGITSYANGSNINFSNVQVGGGSGYGGSAPADWDADYQNLLNDGAYTNTNAGPMNLNLGNLTVGWDYTVQIWMPYWNENWATEFKDEFGNSSGLLNNGLGTSIVSQYVVGSFNATSTTETIYAMGGSSWTVPTGLQLRTTGAPVPEPATMLLFGIGLLGLAGVNRRKK